MKIISRECGGGKTRECVRLCMETGYDLVVSNEDLERIEDIYANELQSFSGELQDFKVYTHSMWLADNNGRPESVGYVIDDVEALLSSICGDKPIGAISVQAGASNENMI